MYIKALFISLLFMNSQARLDDCVGNESRNSILAEMRIYYYDHWLVKSVMKMPKRKDKYILISGRFFLFIF